MTTKQESIKVKKLPINIDIHSIILNMILDILLSRVAQQTNTTKANLYHEYYDTIYRCTELLSNDDLTRINEEIKSTQIDYADKNLPF